MCHEHCYRCHWCNRIWSDFRPCNQESKAGDTLRKTNLCPWYRRTCESRVYQRNNKHGRDCNIESEDPVDRGKLNLLTYYINDLEGIPDRGRYFTLEAWEAVEDPQKQFDECSEWAANRAVDLKIWHEGMEGIPEGEEIRFALRRRHDQCARTGLPLPAHQRADWFGATNDSGEPPMAGMPPPVSPYLAAQYAAEFNRRARAYEEQKKMSLLGRLHQVTWGSSRRHR
jgi:hypothetical protein